MHPYRVVSTYCRERSCFVLWTTSTESIFSLLTAGLDWTLQFVPHIVNQTPNAPSKTQTHVSKTSHPHLFMYLYEFIIVWLLFVHILWYLQHSTVTNTIAAIGFKCERFRHRVMSSCPFLVSFFLLSLSSWEFLSTRRLDGWPIPSWSPQNLAPLPAVYCKLQSHNLYFLKKKKYYQQYILSLFKVVLMGFEQLYFSSHTCML